MHLLITGASGYAGSRLARLAVAEGHHVTGTVHRATGAVGGAAAVGGMAGTVRLDVADRAAVDDLLDRLRPDAVVHTAYRFDDWAVTAHGAAYVAVAAARVGARLVHVSSDAVYAGRAALYTEADLPEPVYAYGAAKAAAETVVRVAHPGAAIVRTSLIVGDDDSKQHQLALELARGQRAGVLFTDHVRHPVGVGDLAAALLELAAGDFAGVLQVAGADAISRHALGVLIAARHGIPADRVPGGSAVERGFVSPTEVRLDLALARTVLRTRLRGALELLA